MGVAFDHTPEAEKALELAVALAEAHGATITVREVVAADLLPAIAGYPVIGAEQIGDELLADAQQRMDARIADLETTVKVTGAAVLGTTAHRLGELEAEVGLLVCGSRGWGTIRRVVLGSTANRLIQDAQVPVLVVPRGTTSGDAPTADAAPADAAQA
jgi:nucleotide-binding universal stress UspA family protein